MSTRPENSANEYMILLEICKHGFLLKISISGIAFGWAKLLNGLSIHAENLGIMIGQFDPPSSMIDSLLSRESHFFQYGFEVHKNT